MTLKSNDHIEIPFRIILISILLSLCCSSAQRAWAQSLLIKNLSSRKDQIVVVYGTSLSSGNCGKSWMQEVTDVLNRKYDNHLKYCLAGKGGMCSTWGVQHLEDSVIAKKPNAVLIEFGINDAFEKYQTSTALAQLNLQYMINRIHLQNPDCEIILQIMNMPVGKSAGLRPNLTAYYDMYRKVAKKNKLLLIDHYPNWQKILDNGETEFLKHVPDGIHPDELSGKRIIAPFIINSLEGIPAKKSKKT